MRGRIAPVHTVLMAGSPAEKRRATYADIEALPAHLTGEIIHGELVVSPRPAPPHALAASMLGVFLGMHYGGGGEGPGGWWVLDEPELHLGIGPDMEPVVPDLVGWRVERMPAPPTTAYFSLAPDWICEVLSPGTAAIDRADKMPFYARAGIGHAWLVDPLLKTIEAYRLDRGGWRLLATHRGDLAVAVEPFEATPIDLSRLWWRRRSP